MKLTITQKDQSNAGPYVHPSNCLIATMLQHRGHQKVKAGPYSVFLGGVGKTLRIRSHNSYSRVRKFYTSEGDRVLKSAIGKKIELVEV